ncbi:nucleotide exchange factor GrpE [Aureisphaera galaxeae]|uniref:nucleotide exchange factor GrpE n=1 Tax=Aureisphaera galaxeae TaxID=1538023 RepID=UPI00235011F7|nr:nucleotide exchange factor GrpE [Aureisphaera galaxeae]MDC8006235.1 nucleotide exchange factor GrpE [Aureisphaera galaxeae]
MSKKDKAQETAQEEVAVEEKKTSKSKAKKEKKDPLKELQAELDQEKDRYLRLFAEFENYKKRTGKERVELFKTASNDVMVSLLPVLDDFDRALKEIEKTDDENLKGIGLISNKLKEALKQKGLEVIPTQVGETFNADVHEAITQIPAPSDDLKGKIIDVIEKGYTLGEKIIRYPKVVIGQ